MAPPTFHYTIGSYPLDAAMTLVLHRSLVLVVATRDLAQGTTRDTPSLALFISFVILAAADTITLITRLASPRVWTPYIVTTATYTRPGLKRITARRRGWVGTNFA